MRFRRSYHFAMRVAVVDADTGRGMSVRHWSTKVLIDSWIKYEGWSVSDTIAIHAIKAEWEALLGDCSKEGRKKKREIRLKILTFYVPF